MPTKKQLEAKTENDSVDYALARGWLNLKMDKVKRSWPDQIFFGPEGETFIVEFKREGEEPRPQQVERIDALRELGHDVYVIDTLAEFILVFERHACALSLSS